MSLEMKLLPVVLCGGQSRRMGQDKAKLVTSAGQSLLDVAVQRFQSLATSLASRPGDLTIDQIVLSLAHQSSIAVETFPGTMPVNPLTDPAASNGPMTGLQTVLRYALRSGYNACLLTPIDTPLLTSDALLSLVDQYVTQPGQILCGQCDNQVHSSPSLEPLIAIYPVSVSEAVDNAMAESRYGMQHLCRSLSARKHPLPATQCFNVNTPQDYDHFSDKHER